MLLAAIAAMFVHGGLAKQESEVDEEKASPMGVAMAATLIGSIVFMMLLYYFTNYDDPDIKKQSWEIISMTISIFCAVLMFQSFNDLVEANFIDKYHLGPFGIFLADMLHMLVWFIFMQAILAWFSGALTVDYDKLKGKEEELCEELETREVDMKCYAVLSAHLTGFASINAWGGLQQLPFFSSHPVLALLAVVIAFFGIIGLQQLTARMRELVAMGDGEKDPFETMWDEETEEAENDVMSLTISFMTVNAWRFAIIGCMPNNEGKEQAPACTPEDFYGHSRLQMMVLWGSALCFTAGVFLMNYYFPESWETTRLPVSPTVAKRLAVACVTSVSMCFSWCTFYGVQMVLAGSVSMFHGESELLSVVLALVCSLGVFGLTIPLDWLADQDWTDEKCDAGIRATIDAFALLVGFSWEQCFDNSVDALASSTSHPHWSKFLLSVFCAGLLVPAWKWYMLPYILRKGYRFGYVWQAEDLSRIAAAFLEEENHGKEGGSGAESKTLQAIQKLHRESSGHLVVATPYMPPTVPAASDPEPSNGELQEEITLLKASLKKAETERDNAQQMYSCQMEAMLENMKKLNLTVTRIP